ncbi:MAG: hypothetical protein ABH800_01045 [Candidatus Nealsonbacteria bacterium]
MSKKTEKGISLYISLMVMSVLLAIALGISAIFIGQVKTLRGLGNSVVAFCAADTGIEQALLNRADPLAISETSLSNGAKYQVFVTAGGSSGCVAPNYCIKSIGTYQNTKRAIEISY